MLWEEDEKQDAKALIEKAATLGYAKAEKTLGKILWHEEGDVQGARALFAKDEAYELLASLECLAGNTRMAEAIYHTNLTRSEYVPHPCEHNGDIFSDHERISFADQWEWEEKIHPDGSETEIMHVIKTLPDVDIKDIMLNERLGSNLHHMDIMYELEKEVYCRLNDCNSATPSIKFAKNQAEAKRKSFATINQQLSLKIKAHFDNIEASFDKKQAPYAEGGLKLKCDTEYPFYLKGKVSYEFYENSTSKELIVPKENKNKN